jgi:hypothetical protein
MADPTAIYGIVYNEYSGVALYGFVSTADRMSFYLPPDGPLQGTEWLEQQAAARNTPDATSVSRASLFFYPTAMLIADDGESDSEEAAIETVTARLSQNPTYDIGDTNE